MITKEILEKLEKLTKLNSANNNEANEIVKLYKKFINPGARICATCPESIAPAFAKLKEWYSNNKSKLEDTLKVKNEKKNQDVKPVKTPEVKTPEVKKINKRKNANSKTVRKHQIKKEEIQNGKSDEKSV